MILAAALALAQAALATPPAVAPADEGDPIVVVGERLRRIGVAISVGLFTGNMKCRVTSPSGDERLDAVACELSLQCARQERRNRERTRACTNAAYDAWLDENFSDGSNTDAADQ
jgi:hypothetical protein